MKKNRLFKGIFYAMVLIGFASCATGSVYLKDVSKYSQTPFKSEIEWENSTFIWGDYKLISNADTKKKIIDFSDFGMQDYKTKKGIVSDFKKSKKFMYEVKFLTGVKEINKDVILNDNSESFIVIDSIKLKVTTDSHSVMIEDSSYMPIKVTRITQVLREGKVYDMLGNTSAGVKISLYGQDYAVIDLIAENPTILMNNKFNYELTTEETDFAAALLLSIYEYNQGF